MTLSAGAKRGIWLSLAAAALYTTLSARPNDESRWMVVARDSNYTISLDTSRILALSGRTYEIWYRTDHAAMRYYKEKAFTRETVHAILRCERYSYRVASVAMSMGDGRAVTRQITEPSDLARQEWRRVEAGTTDADAARATCVVADWSKWRRQ